MTTEVDIVNLGLRRIGARPITTMDDTTPNGAIASDVYATERDTLLRAHTWNFAVARASLTKSGTAPTFEYANAFELPDDFLRVIAVYDNEAGDGAVRYKMETLEISGTFMQIVATGASDLWLKYVRQVTEPDLMTPQFRNLLGLRCARFFAIGVANSNTLLKLVDDELQIARREAKSIDGMEDFPDSLPEGSWVASRGDDAWGRWQPW